MAWLRGPHLGGTSDPVSWQFFGLLYSAFLLNLIG